MVNDPHTAQARSNHDDLGVEGEGSIPVRVQQRVLSYGQLPWRQGTERDREASRRGRWSGDGHGWVEASR